MNKCNINQWTLLMTCSIIMAGSACVAESLKANNSNNFISSNIILPQRQTDTLNINLELKGGKKLGADKKTVTYVSEQLVRGKTIFTGKGLKHDDKEMRPTLKGEASLSFAADKNGNATAVLSLPLRNHPFGFFYLRVSMADETGKTMLADKTPYIVTPEIPEPPAGSIAGFDVFGNSWDTGAIGSPGSKPTQERMEVLRENGFTWAHMRAIWGQYPDMEKRLGQPGSLGGRPL